MVATTMVSISSLVSQLKADYPQFRFVPGGDFHWHPDTATITYRSGRAHAAELLHELAHACADHRDFSRDIHLLEMERDAWRIAQAELAPHYGVPVSNDAVAQALDTYRDWLHARSLCPHCGATGIQSGRSHYRCLACLATWRVNDARHCALRRYTTKNPA